MSLLPVTLRVWSAITPTRPQQAVNRATCSLFQDVIILLRKPDLFITTSKEFAAQVYNDTTWQLVPAVQNHRVYLIPASHTTNWFDRPPGVNRIVSIPWTAHVLYPDLLLEDRFRGKAKEFYAIYYHYDLSGEELTALLSG